MFLDVRISSRTLASLGLSPDRRTRGQRCRWVGLAWMDGWIERKVTVWGSLSPCSRGLISRSKPQIRLTLVDGTTADRYLRLGRLSPYNKSLGFPMS